RLADAGSRARGPHQRPAVLPADRVQVNDAAVDARVLEVDEPPFAPGRIDKRPLVRSVDRRLPLLEHNSIFVGTEDLARPQRDLPAPRDAARGSEDEIPAVVLVELR